MNGVATLTGRTLVAATVTDALPDLTLEFDDGWRLRTFATDRNADAEHWLLFLPEGRVLVAGPAPRSPRDPAERSAPMPDDNPIPDGGRAGCGGKARSVGSRWSTTGCSPSRSATPLGTTC